MSKFAIRLLTLAMFSMALVAAPLVTKAYAAPDSDAPPPSSSSKKAKKKTSEVTPSIKDAAFAKGYRDAYATIYDRNDYAAAIGQLKALGHDDNAAVEELEELDRKLHVADTALARLHVVEPFIRRNTAAAGAAFDAALDRFHLVDLGEAEVLAIHERLDER